MSYLICRPLCANYLVALQCLATQHLTAWNVQGARPAIGQIIIIIMIIMILIGLIYYRVK